MTNSESSHPTTERIIRRIAELMEASHLEALIDGPVAEALAKFDGEADAPYDHRQFHELIGEFVRRVHDHGPACSRRLTSAEARAEAIALLAQGYEGAHARGYDAALVDAADPDGPGVQLVLWRLAEILKEQLKQAYARWVFVRHVSLADWPSRCDLAEAVLNRYSYCLPLSIRGGPSDRWADLVPELLSLCLDALPLAEAPAITRLCPRP